MKSLSFILILSALFCLSLGAQDSNISGSSTKDLRKNSIYFELLGNGILYSLNYDRIIPLMENTAFVLRIGGNNLRSQTNPDPKINPLGEISFLYGGPKVYFDPGVGYTYVGYTYLSDDQYGILVYRAGCRLQGKKGLMMRFGAMLLQHLGHEPSFRFNVGLSLGYAF